MRFEFSAGGIVFQKNPSASSGQAKVLVLVCQHSQHHGWVFPKGIIGDTNKKEGKEETALREVKEETGITGKIMQDLAPVTYWYMLPSKGRSAFGRKGEKIKKTVYYFLMDYVSGDIENHDDEMENVEWLSIDQVEKRLTYKSDKEVWENAQKLMIHNS